MLHIPVTSGASIVVGRDRQVGGSVRIVAGDAGKHTAACAKASGLTQVDRLVTDVPGIRPIEFGRNCDSVIHGIVRRWGLAMTGSAELIQFHGVQTRGVPDHIGIPPSRDMPPARTMAGLASHTVLRWRNRCPSDQP